MKRESLSVAFTCGLGALIGGILALTFGGMYWIFGALFGGCVGYITDNFHQVRIGVARAYHATIAWRPKGYVIVHYLSCATALFLLLASWIVGVGALLAGVAASTGEVTTGRNILIIFTFGGVVIGALAALVVPAVGWIMEATDPTRRKKTDAEHREALRSNSQEIWEIVLLLNAITWTLHKVWIVVLTIALLVYQVGYFVFHLPRLAIAGGRKIRAFVVLAFFYIHSQRRLICFVDATIGAAVGYMSGNAFLGAAAGAILGFINYEVVSVRWLKIVPAHSSSA